MGDIFTKGKRRAIMASISGKETKPEILVRSFLFRQGFRFRKNVKNIIGKPDIVLAKYKTIIFVHGCFWHSHSCKRAKLPTTNSEFWQNKISRNLERDVEVNKVLKECGWNIITIWTCEIINSTLFEARLNGVVAKLRGLKFDSR